MVEACGWQYLFDRRQNLTEAPNSGPDSLGMFSSVKQTLKWDMAELLALQVSQKRGVYGKNPARRFVTTVSCYANVLKSAN